MVRQRPPQEPLPNSLQEDDLGAAGTRALSDVRPDEVFLEVGRKLGRWDLGGRLAHRWRKSDPGGGEVAIPSSDLMGVSAGYSLSSSLSLRMGASNLLDEDYFRSADRKAPPASGRSVALRLSWQSGQAAR